MPASPPALEQFAKMLDVRGHARQFFADVAALHKHGHFLEHSLLVELRPGGRGQPLRQPLLVALLDLRTQLRHAGSGCGKPVQRAAQNRRQGFAFAGAHGFQLLEQRNRLFQNARGERRQIVVLAFFALQCAGQTQRRIQIRLALQPVLAPRRVKGGEIARNQLAIESGLGLRVALDREGQIDVAADQVLLQHSCAAPSPARPGPTAAGTADRESDDSRS